MRKRIVTLAVMAGALAALLASAPAAAQNPRLDIKKPPLEQGPVISLLKPDLRIRRIWFARFVDNPNVQPLVAITAPLKLNEKVLMICDLANEGSANVKGLWQLGYYIDNVMLWNNSWGDLAAGAPLRGVGPYTPTSEGQHSYRAVLDVGDVIKESKEDNNKSEILFQVIH
ncbi:MAG: hypothetical protein NTZ26_05755 [Candidatus Aminicenantes bacterium]|nr:hypothetical protein [Candidatus Aminicenantes bacterium]